MQISPTHLRDLEMVTLPVAFGEVIVEVILFSSFLYKPQI